MGTSRIEQAQQQLLDEVNQLESGKESIDKFIEEKQKQIAEFNLLINEVSNNSPSKLNFKDRYYKRQEEFNKREKISRNFDYTTKYNI